MTGPQGMGPLKPYLLNADIPVEFLGALFADGRFIRPDPLTWLWQPGDYIVMAAWNRNGGTLTVPSWLTRLDGGAATDNPALMGGFIVDGLEMGPTEQNLTSLDLQQVYNIVYTEPTNAARMEMVARYRNVNSIGAAASVHGVFDNSPVNLSLPGINADADGFSVFMELIGGGGTAVPGLSDFVPQGTGITQRTASDIGHRTYDKAGPLTSYAWNVNSTPALSNVNHGWATALPPGPLVYDPQNTPVFVAAGTAVTGSGTSTTTIPMPAGMNANDMIVIVTHANDNAGDGFQDQAGWLRLGRLGSHSRDTRVFFKRAIGGGSDASAVFNMGWASALRQAQAFAYRNVGGVQMINGVSAGTLTPGRNTTIPNTLALATQAADFYVPTSLSPLDGYTQRALIAQTSGGGLAFSEKLMASPGNPGYPTLNTASGDFKSSALIYLLPN